MDLIKIIIKVRHSAAQLNLDRKRKLREGRIKEVISDLDIRISREEEKYLSKLTGKKAVAQIIVDTWKKAGINNVNEHDVEKAL